MKIAAWARGRRSPIPAWRIGITVSSSGRAPDGPVTVLVIPTDEEQVVADEALRVRAAES
ncbi:hypothetical protein BWR60_34390 [Inquilinus limosus]|uniref:Uncharacterized protein n=1 Tax=Inquilinus limosus TaxID=171674 RepID=A0A211YVW0_9PROT|nr:hypothetical protein BWR60_34390 [Inquilinus limosus]